jgi:hypothetical protein
VAKTVVKPLKNRHKNGKRGGVTSGSFKPGNRASRGRPKGTPNKVTQEFRETVRQLLEANAGNVGRWLDQVAEDDPARALDLLSKLAEYASPKLGRTEHTGRDGADLPVPTGWVIQPVQPPNRRD